MEGFFITALMSNEAQIVFRVLLAVCFGSLIGIEREHAHRPAGIRTHILVCVGSCLVMLTSEFLYGYYHQFSPNMDIARLGAQVISGIGFLGAGTIIRNGSSVKGLTTAASIWTVACIGLATGAGFYFGATISTILIFLCLAYLKKFSKLYDRQRLSLEVVSSSENITELVSKIEQKLVEDSINIDKLSINVQDNNDSEIFFLVSMISSYNSTSLVSSIYSLPGVISVNINSKKIIKEEV